MRTLAYSVNLEKLFNIQDEQLNENNVEKNKIKFKGIRNKERLLKIVLPFVHSVYALHNRKCKLVNGTSTGCRGLLGINKVDIDKEIDFIVNTDCHLIWSDNYSTFTFKIGSREMKIWLNDREGGCYKSTPHLEYSMTSINSIYGSSIEDELVEIAKRCAIYTDDWK